MMVSGMKLWFECYVNYMYFNFNMWLLDILVLYY